MKSFIRALVTLAVIAGIGIAAYSWLSSNSRENQSAPSPTTTQTPAPQPSAPPAIQYPIPTETIAPESARGEKPKALPAVDQSDSTIEGALEKLLGKKRFEALFDIDNFVRRVVVTIENASKNKQIPADFSVLKPLESPFRVTGKGDAMSIDPDNSRRYAPMVDLIRNVNERKLVAAYVHFYPLFQSAYQDLGTQEYFNDRVIQLLDDLLQTPEVLAPIRVVPSGAYHTYKYADERLEALSTAQKALIRMGDENAQAVKAKLRQVRALLVHFRK